MENFLRAALTRMQNKRTRKAEQKLLADEIAAFEEWQHTHPIFEDEPRILEMLTRALQDSR